MLTEHRVQAGRQIGTRYQLENVRWNRRAQCHLVQLDAALLCQQRLERKAIAIRYRVSLASASRIAAKALGLAPSGFSLLARLDDASRIDVQLARQFVHGLARNVRRAVARPAVPERGSRHSLLIALRELLWGRNPTP